MQLFLTPSSVAFLCQFLFVALLAAFSWSLYRRTEAAYQRSVLFFALAISGCALLLLIFFLDVSLLSAASSIAGALIFPLSAGLLILLVLFAFSYPASGPRPGRSEHWLLVWVAGFYFLAEVWFAAIRILGVLGQLAVYGRPAWLDALQFIVILSLGALFFTQILVREPKEAGRPLWIRVISPRSIHARAYRGFLIIWAIPILLWVSNYLYAWRVFSLASYYLAISLGVVVTLLGFTFTLVRTLPLSFRFRQTVSIITLAVLLLSLSVLGWAIVPFSSSHYRPPIPIPTTYQFTPIEGGTAYAVTRSDSSFDADLGDRLNLRNGGDVDSYTIVDLGFPFTFFQRQNTSIFLSVNGVVSFDKPFQLASMLEGRQAGLAIVPMYVDLLPAEPTGGVFTRRTEDGFLITWYRSPSRQAGSGFYTFQVALHPSGVFELSYGEIPETLLYSPDNDPQAAPLFAGVLCTDPALCNLSRPFDPQSVSAFPARVESVGFILDFYRQYRSALNADMAPVAGLVGAAALLIVAAQFALLRVYVDAPLNGLLQGMRKLEQGRLDVDLPVYYADEFGQLTRQFNAMAGVVQSVILSQEGISPGSLRYPGLTPTQWEVLQLVAEGKVYKEIGRDLHLAERTVKYHVGRILEILGVDNRTQAIALAHNYLNKVGGGPQGQAEEPAKGA